MAQESPDTLSLPSHRQDRALMLLAFSAALDMK
jgi:hypothetical protein